MQINKVPTKKEMIMCVGFVVTGSPYRGQLRRWFSSGGFHLMCCLDFWTADAEKAVDALQVQKQLIVLTAWPSREGGSSASAELLQRSPWARDWWEDSVPTWGAGRRSTRFNSQQWSFQMSGGNCRSRGLLSSADPFQTRLHGTAVRFLGTV